MIVCFECDTQTKDLMDRLVAVGQYTDYSSVIKSAVNNLDVLQKNMVQGALVFDELEDIRSPYRGGFDEAVFEHDRETYHGGESYYHYRLPSERLSGIAEVIVQVEMQLLLKSDLTQHGTYSYRSD